MIPLSGVSVAVEFIKRFWKPISILVIIGGALFYVNHLQGKVENLELKLKNETQRADLCEEGKRTLKKAIDDQNESLKVYIEAGKEATQKAKEAAVQAANTAARYNALVDKIRKEPKPVGCEASIKYLRDGLPELKWEKK